MYARSDQFYVRLADDPVPWSDVKGGEIRSYHHHRTRYGDLTLTRPRSDQNLPYLYDHILAVGKQAEVVVEQMKSNGKRLGIGLVYHGRIDVVLPVEYDANSTDAGWDRVVFHPSNVSLLQSG